MGAFCFATTDCSEILLNVAISKAVYFLLLLQHQARRVLLQETGDAQKPSNMPTPKTSKALSESSLLDGRAISDQRPNPLDNLATVPPLNNQQHGTSENQRLQAHGFSATFKTPPRIVPYDDESGSETSSMERSSKLDPSQEAGKKPDKSKQSEGYDKVDKQSQDPLFSKGRSPARIPDVANGSSLETHLMTIKESGDPLYPTSSPVSDHRRATEVDVTPSLKANDRNEIEKPGNLPPSAKTLATNPRSSKVDAIGAGRRTTYPHVDEACNEQIDHNLKASELRSQSDGLSKPQSEPKSEPEPLPQKPPGKPKKSESKNKRTVRNPPVVCSN
jgi:hypothetical protein